MFRTKLGIGMLLAVILLATQVFVAGAAPANQDSTIIGNVDSIEVQTNPDTLVTTVLVTITDETGTQIVELSLETALAFEPPLVTLDDDTGLPVPNEEIVDTTIEVDQIEIISTEPVEEPEKGHPVASALSDFFSNLLNVDYDMIMDYHEDGYGFGVIAQALWMTNAIGGDLDIDTRTDIFSKIVVAKKSKDFSELAEAFGVTMPDGSTPQNWGQFRKVVMSDRDKFKENLGAIMSGRAENPGEETLLEQGIGVKSNNGIGLGKGNKGKNNSDDTIILGTENSGKSNPGNSNNKSNNANNKNKDKVKDKSNNGKNK